MRKDQTPKGIPSTKVTPTPIEEEQILVEALEMLPSGKSATTRDGLTSQQQQPHNQPTQGVLDSNKDEVDMPSIRVWSWGHRGQASIQDTD